MFLYFSHDGSLKEIVNDKALRIGNSNINKIYCYWEDSDETEVVWYQFRDVNGNIIGQKQATYTTDKREIPFNKRRDLKFFQYYKTYFFKVIEVPDEVLSASDTILCNIEYATEDSITQMGLLTFNVETDGSDRKIAPDEYLSLSQFKYLEKMITDYTGKIDDKFPILNIGSPSPGLTMEQIFAKCEEKLGAGKLSYHFFNPSGSGSIIHIQKSGSVYLFHEITTSGVGYSSTNNPASRTYDGARIKVTLNKSEIESRIESRIASNTEEINDTIDKLYAKERLPFYKGSSISETFEQVFEKIRKFFDDVDTVYFYDTYNCGLVEIRKVSETLYNYTIWTRTGYSSTGGVANTSVYRNIFSNLPYKYLTQNDKFYIGGVSTTTIKSAYERQFQNKQNVRCGDIGGDNYIININKVGTTYNVVLFDPFNGDFHRYNGVSGDIDFMTLYEDVEATQEHEFAKKDWTLDEIRKNASHLLAKNANGDAFATKAELDSATVFYWGSQVHTPDENDTVNVLADETHDNKTTIYSYQNGSWTFNRIQNVTTFTQEQLAAINSGVTSEVLANLSRMVNTIVCDTTTEVGGIAVPNLSQEQVSDIHNHLVDNELVIVECGENYYVVKGTSENDEGDVLIFIDYQDTHSVSYILNSESEEVSIVVKDKSAGAKLIDVGSYQTSQLGKVFPQITNEQANEIYNTFTSGTPVIIRWKIVGALPLEYQVLSSDNATGNTFDIIVHNEFLCEYTVGTGTYATLKIVSLGGSGGGVDNTAMHYKKLTYDGTNIKDGDNVLNFSQIKELVDNVFDFVYIDYPGINATFYYDAYEDDAIWFQAKYLINGQWWFDRIIINSQNQINYSSDIMVSLVDGKVPSSVLPDTTLNIVDTYSGAYNGEDLAVKFASEISNFANIGAWLQNRIDTGNFKGLRIHDYFLLTLTNNEVFEMEIAGINTYLDSSDLNETKLHIDFVSKDLWTVATKWNNQNYNNGITFTFDGDGATKSFNITSELNSRGATNYPHLIDTIQYTGGGATKTLRNNSGYTYDNTTGIITITGSNPAPDSGTKVYIGIANPVLCSNVYAQVNALKTCVPNGTTINPALMDVDYTSNGLYALLPEWIKPYIKAKPMQVATRFTTTAIRTNADNRYDYAYPKLWLLEEMEVYGTPMFATGTYDKWFAKQYPAFIGNSRIKRNGRKGSRAPWWLASTSSGSATYACYVDYYGTAYYPSMSYYYRVPLCFRFKKA